MASALTLTAVTTRNGKLRTLTLIGTDEVRSQIEQVFDAIKLPQEDRDEIFADEGGFEIDRNLITSVDLNTKGFVNGEDLGDTLWDQFTDAQIALNNFIERFEDVRVIAEVA